MSSEASIVVRPLVSVDTTMVGEGVEAPEVLVAGGEVVASGRAVLSTLRRVLDAADHMGGFVGV